ncbi:MAG: hypothetical protein LBJ61_00425 [Deltaproteobacteria bacterium]|nr:hypothetical protein [Deltaproteobacteria bacterium]
MTLAKTQKDVKAGGEVELHCPKCQRKTPHKILSVQADLPRQVSCMTCDTRHVNRPGQTDAPEAEAATATKAAGKTTAKPAAKDTAAKDAAAKKPAAAKASKPTATKGAAKTLAAKAKVAEETEAAEVTGEIKGTEGTEGIDGTESTEGTGGTEGFDGTEGAEGPGAEDPGPEPPRILPKAKAKAPVEPKTPKESKEAKEAKEAKRAATEELELNKAIWQELKARFGNVSPVPYNLAGNYGLDQVLSHDKFGLGFVTKVIEPNKIEVHFDGFVKTLVMRVGARIVYH